MPTAMAAAAVADPVFRTLNPMLRTANPVFGIVAVRTVQASLGAMAVHYALHWPWTGPHALGLFLTPALCAYFVFVFVAPWTWGLPILARLDTQERVVALTFDDGPTRAVTPRILEALARCEAKATFFVLGSQVPGNEVVLRGIAEGGHTLGLHGQTHAPLVLPPWGRVGRTLAEARASVERACPKASIRWLRAPHGFKSMALPWLARRADLELCAWSINSRDYQLSDPQQIAHNVLKAVRPGAIVLLHDGEGCAATAEALPLILDGLARQGYRCVALPSLGESV